MPTIHHTLLCTSYLAGSQVRHPDRYTVEHSQLAVGSLRIFSSLSESLHIEMLFAVFCLCSDLCCCTLNTFQCGEPGSENNALATA